MIALTDANGNVVNRYSYDPYGNTTSASEQVSNPFRYIGAIWDSQTGLYEMGERYYDPSTGRFTQLDPLGGGYGYAGDNPINAPDPSGMEPEGIEPIEGGGDIGPTPSAGDEGGANGDSSSGNRSAKSGRSGKSAVIRRTANDPKQPRRVRGWYKQEQNARKRSSSRRGKSLRNPPGHQYAHKPGKPAKKGYSYEHSQLNYISNHRLQHQYEGY